MGNFTSGLYYDLNIKPLKSDGTKKNELYNYAYYLDAHESILFTKAYDKENEVINKAIMRANLEKPLGFCNTPKGRFCYLAGLPKDLLKDCAFQKDAKNYWDNDEATLLWALKYRGVDECRN